MGLAKLCAKVATHEEMADLLEKIEEENTRFRMAILWALGEHEEFPMPPEDVEGKLKRRYYWRTELRKRAGL